MIYQDNESCEKILNNRGSLGQTSRAMDLEILPSRNRIEGQGVQTGRKATGDMVADIGTKALPWNTFARLRDIMNGYSLVKAAYPNKVISPYVYGGDEGGMPVTLVHIKQMIMEQPTFM